MTVLQLQPASLNVLGLNFEYSQCTTSRVLHGLMVIFNLPVRETRVETPVLELNWSELEVVAAR